MLTWRRSTVRLLATALSGAIAMAVAMGFGRFSYTPILPGMMLDVPLSPGEAGVIAAANFVGYLLGAVLAGLSFAQGRERVIGLGMLVATTLLLCAMGLANAVVVFAVIRFLAGMASAFTMIMISQIVLTRGAAAGSTAVQSLHFAGVGLGIAASSLMVWLLPAGQGEALANWREAWFAGAFLSLLGTACVALLLPEGPVTAGTAPAAEPRLVWTRPFAALTLTYGLFGFGYVITATFLVAMARAGAVDHTIEFLCWLVTGLSAAVSVAAWRQLVPRFGIVGVYLIGLVVEAAGLVLTVVLPFPAAPLAGGLLLGATFIMITAFGLQIGRALAPASQRRALAIMTAAFGIGQIIGPLVAGWLAGSTGSFTLPTLIASAVLILCAGIILVERRGIRLASGL
ncbi:MULTISPECIES: YbfB/YjiJ family MFS transporter [unclassified Rhizobium]|uniref:YbfB/YjiJ family MFS transporter n=1 Tax=unclassified Rhizobium TaxID=2613769 RepID=UPI000AD129FC|nr:MULTISPECIES: YbfB/YjiJ family MFS transporter [unclassified Rhizobium]